MPRDRRKRRFAGAPAKIQSRMADLCAPKRSETASLAAEGRISERRLKMEVSPPLSSAASEKMVITPVGGSRQVQIALISTTSPNRCADERRIMNFKGISAPLNVGRLEQMLSLAQPRRVAETQDANDKASGSESVRGLEAENLCRSSAYK